MVIFDREARFSFSSKAEADNFCKKLREDGMKYDVVTILDILRLRGDPIPYEMIQSNVGYHYGYSRKEIKKFKPEKIGSGWVVRMGMPGKMVRDENGYWTTDTVNLLDLGAVKGG